MFYGQQEFLDDGGVAHETVVGAEGDADPMGEHILQSVLRNVVAKFHPERRKGGEGGREGGCEEEMLSGVMTSKLKSPIPSLPSFPPSLHPSPPSPFCPNSHRLPITGQAHLEHDPPLGHVLHQAFHKLRRILLLSHFIHTEQVVSMP